MLELRASDGGAVLPWSGGPGLATQPAWWVIRDLDGQIDWVAKQGAGAARHHLVTICPGGMPASRFAHGEQYRCLRVVLGGKNGWTGRDLATGLRVQALSSRRRPGSACSQRQSR
jgi:hypothetical protein